MFLPFFCLDDIYRPGLEKVQFGRPNPNQHNSLNFYLKRKKKHSTQHCMYYNILPQIFNFHFSLFLKKILKNVSKNLSKCLTIYIIINFFFFNQMPKHCCEVFADVNAIYFTVLWWIMNDSDWFGTLKTQLFRKCIWILFLLWKWIKYTFVLFVLKRCLELGVLLRNQLELLYSIRNKMGVGPPFCKFFIIHPRKKKFKIKMMYNLI